MEDELDLLVLGSGVAGLSAGVNAAEAGMRVGVLTKGELSQSATQWAQGGVAAALGGDPDSADLHLADTLEAGAGLCEARAVRVLVDEGPDRLHNLIALGAVFDRDAHGRLALAREGGHSVPRVVHAGGAATGAEIERTLVGAVRETAASVMERWFALDLVVEGPSGPSERETQGPSGPSERETQGPSGPSEWGDRRCRGVEAIDAAGRRHRVRARHTLLATGGAGQLYAVTTNPEQATGDGVAMAMRAGIAVSDLEFVQFHPTALHHPQVPRPLLSEALRGHGALMRDADGERFVDELASRDVVARAMTVRMLEQGVDHLWLDATPLERFDERFPTIAAALGAAGLDPAVDWLPIAPAAHYLIGGVVTDLDGATALPSLWAAGEVACTGVHGANRLGSNSLLEGLVFAARVVEAIAAGKDGPEPTGVMAALVEDRVVRLPNPTGDEFPRPGEEERHQLRRIGGRGDEDDVGKLRERLQRAMTTHAGVVRDTASLDRADEILDAIPSGDAGDTLAARELANLRLIARALVAAALAREESRGAHNRTDHPRPSTRFERRVVIG